MFLPVNPSATDLLWIDPSFITAMKGPVEEVQHPGPGKILKLWVIEVYMREGVKHTVRFEDETNARDVSKLIVDSKQSAPYGPAMR